MELVLGSDDEAGVKDAAFDVIDDDALHLGTKSHQDVADQIVGERPLLAHATHEHGDGRADGFINVDDEDLLGVADEHSKTALQRQNGPHLHFDDFRVHAVIKSHHGRMANDVCVFCLSRPFAGQDQGSGGKARHTSTPVLHSPPSPPA